MNRKSMLAAVVAWRTLAVTCVVLGIIGAFVPVLPTVPFLLVAAWAAGKGWPRLETWLLDHPKYGATIRRWREHGAVPRRAKWAASGMMLLSAAMLVWSPVPVWVKWAVPALMAAVALWLWLRPET